VTVIEKALMLGPEAKSLQPKAYFLAFSPSLYMYLIEGL